MSTSIRTLTTRIAPGLALLTLVACGSVPTRSFKIDAIDSDEEPRPCMIVIDQDWVGAAERQQYVNVNGDDELTIELTFDKNTHEIGVAPMRVVNGKPESPKRATDSSDQTGYVAQFRMVQARDAEKQLFIVTRK